MHKTLIGFLLLAAIGCGGSSDSQMIVGDWFASAAPNWASADNSTDTTVIINFTADGQYSASKVLLASTTVTDVQAETGTYTLNGSTLTTVPVQWTCPYDDPSYTVFISFVGDDDLEMDTSSGVVSLHKTNVRVDEGLEPNYGCFYPSGFTQEPFGPAS